MFAKHLREAFQHIFNLSVRLQSGLMMLWKTSCLAPVAKNGHTRVLSDSRPAPSWETIWIPSSSFIKLTMGRMTLSATCYSVHTPTWRVTVRIMFTDLVVLAPFRLFYWEESSELCMLKLQGSLGSQLSSQTHPRFSHSATLSHQHVGNKVAPKGFFHLPLTFTCYGLQSHSEWCYIQMFPGKTLILQCI